MKNKALFSSKDKSKKLKCRVLQFLIGALSVITPNNYVTRTLRIRLVTLGVRNPTVNLVVFSLLTR